MRLISLILIRKISSIVWVENWIMRRVKILIKYCKRRLSEYIFCILLLIFRYCFIKFDFFSRFHKDLTLILYLLTFTGNYYNSINLIVSLNEIFLFSFDPLSPSLVIFRLYLHYIPTKCMIFYFFLMFIAANVLNNNIRYTSL